MKRYEIVDEFIADTVPAVGDRYTKAGLRAWCDERGIEADASMLLQSHRCTPGRVTKKGRSVGRAFTGQRVGLGPNSYYVLVESEDGRIPKSVREMGQQSGEESVARMIAEAKNRMAPLVQKDGRAKRFFETYATQLQLVASVFDSNIDALLAEILGEDSEEA